MVPCNKSTRLCGYPPFYGKTDQEVLSKAGIGDSPSMFRAFGPLNLGPLCFGKCLQVRAENCTLRAQVGLGSVLRGTNHLPLLVRLGGWAGFVQNVDVCLRVQGFARRKHQGMKPRNCKVVPLKVPLICP